MGNFEGFPDLTMRYLGWKYNITPGYVSAQEVKLTKVSRRPAVSTAPRRKRDGACVRVASFPRCFHDEKSENTVGI